MLQKIKDEISRYWFFGSSALLALAYFLIDNQRRTISDLKIEVENAKLGKELEKIHAQSTESQKDYEAARSRYLELKRRYDGVFKRLP